MRPGGGGGAIDLVSGKTCLQTNLRTSKHKDNSWKGARTFLGIVRQETPGLAARWQENFHGGTNMARLVFEPKVHGEQLPVANSKWIANRTLFCIMYCTASSTEVHMCVCV